MLTEPDVLEWMRENPELAYGICMRFLFGYAAGQLRAAGMTEAELRNTLENALAAFPKAAKAPPS